MYGLLLSTVERVDHSRAHGNIQSYSRPVVGVRHCDPKGPRLSAKTCTTHFGGCGERTANVIGISRYVANRRLRSVLIQGARAYVHKRKQAASAKDEWLLNLVARSGYGKAAVALANKNVRTAWAMLTQGTEYKCKPCLGNAA
jgi:hypothetical protein